MNKIIFKYLLMSLLLSSLVSCGGGSAGTGVKLFENLPPEQDEELEPIIKFNIRKNNEK